MLFFSQKALLLIRSRHSSTEKGRKVEVMVGVNASKVTKRDKIVSVVEFHSFTTVPLVSSLQRFDSRSGVGSLISF
jgi:hypothetical protein